MTLRYYGQFRSTEFHPVHDFRGVDMIMPPNIYTNEKLVLFINSQMLLVTRTTAAW